jgi:hypothetical protein
MKKLIFLLMLITPLALFGQLRDLECGVVFDTTKDRVNDAFTYIENHTIKDKDTITNGVVRFDGQEYLKNNIKIVSSDSIALDGSANSGTDLEVTHAYEAFKFTPTSTITVSSMAVYVKKTGTITNVTDYLQMDVYADNFGVPGTAIGVIHEYERYGYITTSFTRFDGQITGLTSFTAGTSYWIVIYRNVAPSGGSVYLDTKNTGTAQYAYSTNGTAWTTANNVTGRFLLFAPHVACIDIENKNYTGIKVSSTTEYSIQGDCIWDYAGAFTSVNNFATLSYSLYGIGSKSMSPYNIGFLATSTESTALQANSINGNGIYTDTYSRTNSNAAIRAYNYGAGYGVYANADSSDAGRFQALLGHGVYGFTSASTKSGIRGENTVGYGGSFYSNTNSGNYSSSSSSYGSESVSGSGIASHHQVSPSSTNTIVSVIKLDRYSSGTATAGIGGSIEMNARNNVAALANVAKINYAFTDVTTIAEDGVIKLSTNNKGTMVDDIIVGHKTLTDGSATGLFTISLPTTGQAGGSIDYIVRVTSAAGDSLQVQSGEIKLAAINIGGSYTTSIDATDADMNYVESHAALTLTEDWTITTGTNNITINANFGSSISVSTVRIDYEFHTGTNKRAVTIL